MSMNELKFGLAALISPPLFGATIIHDYSFLGNLSDSLGGPNLVSQGGTVNSNNYTFPSNLGLSLTSGFTGNADYSVVMHFSFTDLAGYRRILDLKNRTSDTGLYNLNSALNFFNITTGAGAPFVANALTTVVLTRNAATNEVTGYVNGVQQIQFIDSSNLAVFDQAGNIAYFFEDDGAVGNEASAGLVDRIQI